MSTNTPYTPPKSTVADMAREFGELNMFTANGRIGRVRYLAWSMGFSVLAMIVLGALVGLGAAVGAQNLAMIIYTMGILGLVVVTAFFVIQRLHDLDKSGWFYLIMFIPLVGALFALYVILAPGSAGANRYGNPPPPNTIGAIALAWLMPIMIIGIIAAVAIPAYQGYVQRAKALQSLSPPIEQQQ